MPAGAPAQDATHELVLRAPAKVNLYLGVHAQTDEAGYHRVDSVMAAVDLADTVHIAPARELSVRMVPAADVPQERNSAYRAATALAAAFDREPACAITIEKRIPICAGLGGPSTDAAATLKGLCRLWGIDEFDARVDTVARSIGADVPFFLYGPVAFLAGRGDALVEEFAPLADMPVVLVKPASGGVAAGDAYRRFDAEPQELPVLEPVLAALRAGATAALPELVANNLAPAACALAPEISEVLDWLRAQPGVLAAEVSGSGSCSFALVASREQAQAVADAAQKHCGWWAHAGQMEK